MIIEDYLLSYRDTKRYFIDFIFQIIDKEYGSSEDFLVNHCNVLKESISTIREVLVKK